MKLPNSPLPSDRALNQIARTIVDVYGENALNIVKIRVHEASVAGEADGHATWANVGPYVLKILHPDRRADER